MSKKDDSLEAFAEEQDQERRQQQHLNARIRLLTAERDKLRSQLGLIESLDTASPRVPRWLTPKGPAKGSSNRATLCLLVTDTHFDEVIDPEQVDGINAYNREIAEMRLEQCFRRAVRLAKHYLTGVTYDGAVLFLGGDIFSGNIHEELKVTNADTLFGSLLHWIGPMLAGIDMLAEEFGKVHVVGVPGNHGRLTRKPIAKQRAADNLDWLLYRLLARELVKDGRVTWEVPASADAHVQVYNCVGVGTRILRDDLRWVAAETLAPGDGVFGFDAELGHGNGRERTRRWRHATILHCDVRTQRAVKITLGTGEELVCTPDHQWLCGTTYGNVTRWIQASEIRPGWTLRRYLHPWTDEESREAGWLAGMFDGEGSLSVITQKRSLSLTVHQNEGPTAERLRERIGHRANFSEGRQKNCIRFGIRGGLAKQLSLIGSIRPERLLPKAIEFLSKNRPSVEAIEDVVVRAVEYIGDANIVILGTSVETYFAEGFGAHNTRYLLTHGDQFKGGSGISGSLAPLLLGTHRKTRRQSMAGRPYDYMVAGHFHQSLFLPAKGLLIGGCLKGFDEFSFIQNYEPEPPQQALWITTPEHGISFSAPVYVMDRTAEGW